MVDGSTVRADVNTKDDFDRTILEGHSDRIRRRHSVLHMRNGPSARADGFTWSWMLQELFAPPTVVKFFSPDGDI